MHVTDHAQAFDDRFHHLVVAVADLLVLEMDDVFLTLLHDAPPHSPQQRTAEVAHRIVVLCRRLVDEIRRYERWDRLRREEEEEQQEELHHDIPF